MHFCVLYFSVLCFYDTFYAFLLIGVAVTPAVEARTPCHDRLATTQQPTDSHLWATDISNAASNVKNSGNTTVEYGT